MNVRPDRLRLMAFFAQARTDQRAREAREAEARKRAQSERAKRRRREKAESDALAAKLATMTPVERSNWPLERRIPDLPLQFIGLSGMDRCTVHDIDLRQGYAVIGGLRGMWDEERTKSIGGLQIRPQPAMPFGALQVTITMLKRILCEIGYTEFDGNK